MLVIEEWVYPLGFFYSYHDSFYLNEVDDNKFQSRIFFSNADNIYINCFENQNCLNKINLNSLFRIYFYKIDKKIEFLREKFVLIPLKEFNFYVRHDVMSYCQFLLQGHCCQIRYKNSINNYVLLSDSALKYIKNRINLSDDFLYELIEAENNGDNTFKFPWEQQKTIEVNIEVYNNYAINVPREIKIELESTWEENEIISYFKTNNELIKNLLEKFLLFKIDQSRWRYI